MAKYQKYAEYKDSGIDWMGAIPKEWSISRLKYIFTIRKRIAGTLGFDVLSITQRGIKVKDTESGNGQLSMDYSKYQLVYEGDFAMNHMDLLTGYVDISKFEGVTSPDYRVFTIDDLKKFNSQYYLYLLQMGYKQKLFFHLGQGSSHLGRWRLPTEAFNEVEYPIPSLNEQSQIANFLDHETTKIDTLIAKQEKLIELLKEKRQAVISHAVTKGLNPNVAMKDSGVEWLGQVPEHWISARLKYYTNQIVDGAHFTPTYSESGIPFLRVTDIHNAEIDMENIKYIPVLEHLDLIQRCKPEKGDLLLSKNGTIGVPKLINWDWQFSIFVSLCLIKFKKNLKAEFAEYFFKSYEIQEQIFGLIKKSTVINLHLDKIQNFWFSIPPIEEQSQIVYCLDKKIADLNKLIGKAELAIQLMQERRTALISAAVTGKIDVRNWQNPNKNNNQDKMELSA